MLLITLRLLQSHEIWLEKAFNFWKIYWYFFNFFKFLTYYGLITAVSYLLIALKSLNWTLESIKLLQSLLNFLLDFLNFFSYQCLINAFNYLLIAWKLLKYTLKRTKLLRNLLNCLLVFWNFWFISTLLTLLVTC